MTLACRDTTLKQQITFSRLTDIAPDEVAPHKPDARVAEHMPLLTSKRDTASVGKFVVVKEDCWKKHGLGHWAILCDGEYIGWGGFHKEGDEWDFGLVLKPGSFGLGTPIARKALAFAVADKRIPFVTLLLPPSRKTWAEDFAVCTKHEPDVQVYQPICNTRQPPRPGCPRLYTAERRMDQSDSET